MVRSCNFISTHNIINIVSFTPSKSIIRFTGVIKIEKPLHPLTHLKVILILGLDKFIDLNVLFDSILVEGRLEYFIILDILII